MSPSPSPPPPAPCPYAAVTLDVTLPSARDDTLSKYQKAKDATVLIVGGGISGIITIQTLKGGITNFEIIEARGKFGGRLPGETFGEPGRQVTVEVGVDWFRGISGESGDPKNPIWTLVQKYVIEARKYSYRDSIAMFDQTGATSFSDTLNDHRNACTRLTTLAKDRVDKGLVNTTARASYGLINVKPKTMHEVAAESEAGYALVLFGFGVLQDDDVTWEPKLPAWKMKAILSMTMDTYNQQGDWSERIESMPDGEARAEPTDILHAMLTSLNPLPSRSRWRSDSLTRRSYSSWSASFFQEHHDNLRAPVNERLWFAGEHCSQKHFPVEDLGTMARVTKEM